MIGLSVEKITNNSRQIVSRIQRRKLQLLDQFGIDVREQSQAIQIESDKSSRVGSPPHVHSPSPNLETIQHVVNRADDSVLAGPIFIPGKNVTPALPGLIERGGRAVIRRRRKTRGGYISTIRVRMIQRRPFILPAAMRAITSLQANARKGF